MHIKTHAIEAGRLFPHPFDQFSEKSQKKITDELFKRLAEMREERDELGSANFFAWSWKVKHTDKNGDVWYEDFHKACWVQATGPYKRKRSMLDMRALK